MAPFYLQRANPSSIKISAMRKKELALLQRVFNMAAMDIAATRIGFTVAPAPVLPVNREAG
jgi:hypothetical protein